MYMHTLSLTLSHTHVAGVRVGVCAAVAGSQPLGVFGTLVAPFYCAHVKAQCCNVFIVTRATVR